MGRPKKFDPDKAVEQAAETFRANGYAETSPQELADRLGIGKSSMYNAFGSKHDLFLKSLERYTDTSLTDLKLVMDTDRPIRERVRCLLEGFLRSDLEDPDRCGCLVVNSAVEVAPQDEPAAQLLGRSFDATEAVLRTAFTAAQKAGEIAPDRNPKALAGLVQSTMIGLRVLAKTRTGFDRFESTIDAVIAAI